MSHGRFDRFFSLLAKMPGASKEDLIWHNSNMLTTSLKEFHEKDPEGYKRMLALMQIEVSKLTISTKDKESIRKHRSAILRRLQIYGVNTTDWSCINHFLEQPQVAGKRLYDMSVEEMERIIPKLESIIRKKQMKLEQERQQIQMN